MPSDKCSSSWIPFQLLSISQNVHHSKPHYCNHSIYYLKLLDLFYSFSLLTCHDIIFLGQKLVLYSTRMNVMMHNAECLGKHPGELHSYESKDCGKSKQFEHMVVEKVSFHKYRQKKRNWCIKYWASGLLLRYKNGACEKLLG